ncbi:hypothetical protein HYW39_02185 [Candidatus Curtissbacteria bacterium]|nr:hypothetical protein [Candidatus Curtissbacteria bacterium]
MSKQAETVCICCGKLRVFYRQWKGKHEGKGTIITHQESVCPDPECQKIVNEKFAAIRELREVAEEKRRNIVLGRKPRQVPK